MRILIRIRNTGYYFFECDSFRSVAKSSSNFNVSYENFVPVSRNYHTYVLIDWCAGFWILMIYEAPELYSKGTVPT